MSVAPSTIAAGVRNPILPAQSTRSIMAYISGPLTGLTEAQRQYLFPLYEAIGKMFEEEFGIIGYVPHVYGDPVKMAHLSAPNIDQIDRKAVTQSYIMIAYVGIPSTGVGIEIEMANHSNVPVLLIYENNITLSRLVRGSPASMGEIRFDAGDVVQLIGHLRGFIQLWLNTLRKQDHMPAVLKP